MLKSINKYIKNNDFSVNILENYININNFLDITILESNKIVFEIPKGYLRIFGDNLVIKRLLDNEVIITGIINSLEFKNNAQ